MTWRAWVWANFLQVWRARSQWGSINSLAASRCELGLWPLCGLGWRKGLLAERGAGYFAHQSSTTEYAFFLWLAVRHLSFYDSHEVHFLIPPPRPCQILLLGNLTWGCLWDWVMPMNFWEVQNQVEGTFSSIPPHLGGSLGRVGIKTHILAGLPHPVSQPLILLSGINS